MNGKTPILFLVLFLLIIPVAFADLGLDSVLSSVGDFVNNYDNYKEVYSFVLFLVFFVALFWIGFNKLSKKLDWGDKSTSAVKALAVVFAFAFSFGLHYLQKSKGFYLIDKAGDVGLLIIAIVMLLALAYLFYKSSKEKSSTVMPYLVSIFVLIIYYVANTIYPDFVDDLGSWGTILEIIVFVAGAIVVIGLFLYLWKTLSGGIFNFGLRARKPLSDGDYKGTRAAIQQRSDIKRAFKERKEAERAERDERHVRKNLRRLVPELKDIASFLGSLAKYTNKEKWGKNKSNWKSWSRRLGKYERLKVVMAAYSGLIAKAIADSSHIENDEVDKMRTELNAFQGSVLEGANDLENKISLLVKHMRNLYRREKAPKDKKFVMAEEARRDASKAVTKLVTAANGGLALERHVRDIVNKA